MNLITCVKNCLYQKDGYCTLGEATSINQKKVDGCSYYKKPESQKTSHNLSKSYFNSASL